MRIRVDSWVWKPTCTKLNADYANMKHEHIQDYKLIENLSQNN